MTGKSGPSAERVHLRQRPERLPRTGPGTSSTTTLARLTAGGAPGSQWAVVKRLVPGRVRPERTGPCPERGRQRVVARTDPAPVRAEPAHLRGMVRQSRRIGSTGLPGVVEMRVQISRLDERRASTEAPGCGSSAAVAIPKSGCATSTRAEQADPDQLVFTSALKSLRHRRREECERAT